MVSNFQGIFLLIPNILATIVALPVPLVREVVCAIVNANAIVNFINSFWKARNMRRYFQLSAQCLILVSRAESSRKSSENPHRLFLPRANYTRFL